MNTIINPSCSLPNCEYGCHSLTSTELQPYYCNLAEWSHDYENDGSTSLLAPLTGFLPLSTMLLRLFMRCEFHGSKAFWFKHRLFNKIPCICATPTHRSYPTDNCQLCGGIAKFPPETFASYYAKYTKHTHRRTSSICAPDGTNQPPT